MCDLIDNIDGRSLKNTINNPQQEVRDYIYLSYLDCQRAVSDKEFKLIQYVIDCEHNMTQLFDLQNDPWELNNLAESDAYSKKLTEMRAKLFQLRDEWDDKDSPLGKTF